MVYNGNWTEWNHWSIVYDCARWKLMGVLKKKQPLSSLLVCGLLMYLADIKYDNQTANKESDFWSCRSCGGNYEPKICLVSYKQWNNLCILKVIRSSSFKQQWMLILTYRLETLEAGEWWGFFEKVNDFSSCRRRHLRSLTSSGFFLLFGQFCELFFGLCV